MHLQLNLSNNLMKSWKPMRSDAPPETDPLLRWRLDQISFGRKQSNYICVNESTLFSFVMTDLAGKKPAKIQQCFLDELFLRLDDLYFPQSARDSLRNLVVLFGKTVSRKIIGCVTDLKKGYQVQHEYAGSHEEMELRVNNTPYPSVGVDSPKRAFLALRRHFAETDPLFTRLLVPEDFVYAARRSLEPSPAGLYSFDMGHSVDGMVEAYLSLQELSELGARLKAGPAPKWAIYATDAYYLRFFYEEVIREMGERT